MAIGRSQLVDLWDRTRSSYWLLPSVMAAGAAALALALVQLDESLAAKDAIAVRPWRLIGAPMLDAETARAILSTIAGGMITATGIVFSITIIALQLASTQFGPRLMRTFMSDLGNQFVLGAFITAFVYSVIVLASMRGGEREFVPQIATLVGIAIGVGVMGVLIFFINHISQSIRIESGVDAISRELAHSIDTLFPEELGQDPPAHEPKARLPAGFEAEARPVAIGEDGYIRHVDEVAIMEIAESHDLTLRLERRPGDFVLGDTLVLLAWPAERVTREVGRDLGLSFAVGPQRTPLQDAEFALAQLVEIAVRSLSPGTNDPFTALVCIDRLGEGLSRLASRRIPPAERHGPTGRLRLVARPITLTSAAARAFDAIMRAGGNDAEVVVRLLDAAHRVARRARRPEDRRFLAELAADIRAEAEQRLSRERDRRMVAEAYAALTGQAEVPAAPHAPVAPPPIKPAVVAAASSNGRAGARRPGGDAIRNA